MPPNGAAKVGLPPQRFDSARLKRLEANKKTALVAYILWFFLGLFGAHNFYLKRIGVAVAQLTFLIPGWVRNQNNLLLAQLGA